MKKLISLTLALIFVFSMATVAMADDTPTPPANPDAVGTTTPTDITFNKRYVVDANATTLVNAATFPAGDVLKFKVDVTQTNPDTTKRITVNDHTVDANADAVTISFPTYDKVGVYEYTISEKAGSTTQGVVNDTSSQIVVKVLVAYNDAHTALTNTVVLGAGTGSGKNENNKVDTILNEYGLGSLKVSKTVSGNLANRSDEFKVDVTFKTQPQLSVRSDITYTGGTIATTEWSAADADGIRSVTKTITLTHGSDVTFSNIPAGVTYTVKERDYTAGDKNVAGQGYDDPKYSLNSAAAAVNNNGVTKTIAANENDTVAIENVKGTDVNTGITLDSLPFVLILAVCAGAVVLFVIKRRNSAEF